MNKYRITQSDALTFLATLQSNSVHVFVTDPPYWTLDKWRKMGTTTRLGGNRVASNQRPEMFFETIDQEYLWELFLEIDRVLAADGHLYMLCDDIVAPILLNWIREAKSDHNFEDAHLLIWDKESMGMGYHYRRRYECIVFAWRKAKRKLRDLGKADVFRYKRITNSYPTEKPAPLLQELITQSLRVGETLCDPFAGSGSVGAACPFDYNATILLNDKSPASIAWMKKRIVEPFKLAHEQGTQPELI